MCALVLAKIIWNKVNGDVMILKHHSMILILIISFEKDQKKKIVQLLLF